MSLDLLDRVPPHEPEAEAAALSAMCFDVAAAWELVGLLAAEDFYETRNAALFGVLRAMLEMKKPLEPGAIIAELEAAKKLEVIGGRSRLAEVLDTSAAPANAAYYAARVRDAAELRALIRIGSELVRDAYDRGSEPGTLKDRAASALLDAVVKNSAADSIGARDLMVDEMNRIDLGAEPVRIPSGLPDLDRIIDGFRPGELVIVAGRPSMGKTALGTTIVREVALRRRVPVALFSLEVPRAAIAQNMLAQHARVDASRVRKGRLSKLEHERVEQAARELAEAPFEVCDPAALTILGLRAKARELRLRRGLALLVVDYLQLVGASSRRTENRNEEVSEVSRGLKQLARELGIPVIAMAQLSRAVESRDGNRPRLSDLRDSGSIEQDADIVLMLYREAYYKPDKPELEGKAEVIVAKNRNGPTGTARLTFEKECLRFECAATFHAPAVEASAGREQHWSESKS